MIIILYSSNSVYHSAVRFITWYIRCLSLCLFTGCYVSQALVSILPHYRTSIQSLNTGPHQTSTRYWITLQGPTVFFLSLPPGITWRMFSSLVHFYPWGDRRTDRQMDAVPLQGSLSPPGPGHTRWGRPRRWGRWHFQSSGSTSDAPTSVLPHQQSCERGRVTMGERKTVW